MNTARILLKFASSQRNSVFPEHIYSALLGIVRERNKNVSALMHDEKIKPVKIAFSCEGKFVNVEVCSVGEKISEEIYLACEDVLKKKKPVRFGRNQFFLSSIRPEDTSFPDGRYGFFILDGSFCMGKAIKMEFLSPTAFRTGDRNYLFPEPGYVFNVLLKKWERFCGEDEKLKVSRDDFNERNIFVVRHRIFTEVFETRLEKMAGFVGNCVYEIDRDAPDSFKYAASVLFEFASFSGVGLKTALGMGNVRTEVLK